VKIIDDDEENLMETCKQLIIKNSELIKNAINDYTQRTKEVNDKLQNEVYKFFNSFIPVIPKYSEITVNKIIFEEQDNSINTQ